MTLGHEILKFVHCHTQLGVFILKIYSRRRNLKDLNTRGNAKYFD